MAQSLWFDDVPTLAELPAPAAAAKLRELGEDEAANALERAHAESMNRGSSMALPDWLPFVERPWQNTAHAFGYLAPTDPTSNVLPIQHAGNIAADQTLKNSRVRIVLNRLRVADYPGGGTHRILFDFYAQNQLADNVEHLHFNVTFRAREGQEAAVIGYPIFIGLHVGNDGIAFKCFTVNVKNDDDEAFLSFLESETFQGGLKLVNTAQPALAPLSQMALGLTKTIATRNRNVPVQDFYMGLDFT